jgi:SAM-dependent methyltransferase
VNKYKLEMKRSIKRMLRWLDHILGIRAWLSSEPNQSIEEMSFLRGSRELEYGWVAANVPTGLGSALDIGCVNSPISPILAMMGYKVVGVDIRDDIPYELNGFKMVQGDFTQLNFPQESFDLVVLCSTVEHIGLVGRYDNFSIPDGDLAAMVKVRNILKLTGVCILTIPVGVDGVYLPWHRVYGNERLAQLLQGYKVLKSRYFVKSGWDKWCESSQEIALSFTGSASQYALGHFILGRDENHVNEKL